MAGIDPLSIGLSLGGKIIDHFFPDPVKKAEALLELQKMEQAGDLAVIGYQADINKTEAGSQNTFIAGWRPFIGWVCGLGMGTQFVFGPIMTWATSLFGHPVPMPVLDLSLLSTMLIGMLGLGGMRTVEKLSSAQGNH
jgi:hypothetical protein